MNDSLNRWLTNRGFTGSLDDKINQYLKSVVVGSAATDTTNDLWIKYGIQEGFPGDIQSIQMAWAKNQGATGATTWNGAMGTLPP